MMTRLTDEQIKEKATRLCELCNQLWPDEWEGKYTGARADLRDWLNDKTGLEVDHIQDKSAALTAWVDKLETLI